MARNISNEVDSSSAGGGQPIPVLGPVSPATGGLSPINPVAAGVSEIQYNMSSGERALKEIASIQVSLNYVNNGLQLTDITNEKNKISQDFLAAHPDARGYGKFMEEGYRSILQNRIDNAPTREIGSFLQQYMNHSLPHVIETSLSKELETGRKYILGKDEETRNVILTQLITHPEDEKLFREQYGLAVTGMKGVFSRGEYIEFSGQAWDQYGKVWGQTLIRNDPDRALNYFESGALNGMVRGTTLTHLMKTAVLQKDAAARRHLTDLKIRELENLREEGHARAGIGAGTASGFTDIVDVEASNLPENVKAEARKGWEETEKMKKKDNDVQRNIMELYIEGKPITGFPDAKIDKFYRDQASNKALQLKRSLTSEEKAMIVIAGKINQHLDSLTRDLMIDLERGSPKDALSASIAVHMLETTGCPRAIGELPNNYRVLAQIMYHNSIWGRRSGRTT